MRKRGPKWQVQIRRFGFQNISKTFHIREDALRWARDVERAMDRGENPTPASTVSSGTISDLLSRYERDVSSKKRSATTEQFYVRVIKRHPIASMTIKQLNASAVRCYRDSRLTQVASGTVRNEMSLLLHAFKIAKTEWGLPIVEEVLQVSKPPPGRPRDRRLAEGEALLLINALSKCRNPLALDVFTFALETGMRRGEVLSLKWKNINLVNHTAFLPITKNGESRTVPLGPKAIKILKKRQVAKNNIQEVFPISANAIRLTWERVKEKSGIMNLRFHDLRHEAVSRFFELGLSVPEVALISGHKDPRMLFRYTHLRATDVAKKLRQKPQAMRNLT
jgi:integrase